MSFFDFGAFSRFRTYDASEKALKVGMDLEVHYSPYMVIRRRLERQDRWYVFGVDEELIRRLKKRGLGVNIEEALRLRKPSRHEYHILEADAPIHTLLEAMPSRGRSSVILDHSGSVRALHTGKQLPPMEATLFPRVRSIDGDEVEQDQVIEFLVVIEARPKPGVTTPLQIQFPKGAESLDLYAEVSSREFASLKGESWSQRFTVNRQLQCTPAQWVFKARAIGDRERYSLTITFHAAGSVIGALVATVVRKGMAESSGPPKFHFGSMELPREPGAFLIMTLANQGGDYYTLRMYEGGKQWDNPVSWGVSSSYFDLLETKSSLQNLKEAGYSLWVDLPDIVRNFLDRPVTQRATTLFVSDGRVAPFEILQIKANEGWPFLGIDRPLVRWVNNLGMPAVTDLNIGQVACIRPQYGTSGDELPSAEEEEKDLQQRFPNRFHVIRRSSELGDLLQNGQVRILHFAGHADGNPAHLVLEDDKVSPARFHPSYPLLRIGRPLFFLNGCRTGKSWSNAPAFLANSVKVLLTSGCSAIVAPMIKVESPAARKAAKVFYDAVANETIVEAVRQVRCLALDRSTPEEDKATYLSYLVFAPPTLKLKFT